MRCMNDGGNGVMFVVMRGLVSKNECKPQRIS